MCSRKWDMPVVPGTSLRPPTWYQTQSETTGACRASRACITSPLSSKREAGTSVRVGMTRSLGQRAARLWPDRLAVHRGYQRLRDVRVQLTVEQGLRLAAGSAANRRHDELGGDRSGFLKVDSQPEGFRGRSGVGKPLVAARATRLPEERSLGMRKVFAEVRPILCAEVWVEKPPLRTAIAGQVRERPDGDPDLVLHSAAARGRPGEVRGLATSQLAAAALATFHGVPNFAAKTAFTAMAESTEPNTPGRSAHSSSTPAIAIEGCSNEA